MKLWQLVWIYSIQAHPSVKQEWMNGCLGTDWFHQVVMVHNPSIGFLRRGLQMAVVQIIIIDSFTISTF